MLSALLRAHDGERLSIGGDFDPIHVVSAQDLSDSFRWVPPGREFCQQTCPRNLRIQGGTGGH